MKSDQVKSDQSSLDVGVLYDACAIDGYQRVVNEVAEVGIPFFVPLSFLGLCKLRDSTLGGEASFARFPALIQTEMAT